MSEPQYVWPVGKGPRGLMHIHTIMSYSPTALMDSLQRYAITTIEEDGVYVTRSDGELIFIRGDKYDFFYSRSAALQHMHQMLANELTFLDERRWRILQMSAQLDGEILKALGEEQL